MAKKKMTLEEKLEEAIVKDIAYKVPENWVWTTIKSICGINMGQSPKGEHVNDVGDGYPLIGGPSDMGELYPLKKRYATNVNKISSSGTIIMSVRATLGKINISDGEYCLGRGVAEIVPKEFSRDYLQYYINFITNDLYKVAKGTTFLQISKPDLESIEVPLPPLKEQQRIVDKIESLFEKLDKAKELIEEARDDFAKRKSAILEKAFNGELIKCHIKEYILKDYVTTQYGYTASSQQQKTDCKFLRITDIQDDYVEWENVPYCIITEKDKEKYLLLKNDIVIARTGATTGKSYLINESVEAVFASYLIRLRVKGENILPEYLYKFLKSNSYWKQIMELRKGIAQPGVNAEKLKNIMIPAPNVEKQKEIVRILDNLLENESDIEELTALEEKIELIKKSILAKAFRGKLGTNCEDDESALELLKEILNKE